ncbi:MAG: prolyl oligopeptidase family serine peptidase [Zetaproteobacteria bacterium]|nr:prolyl oligopeptidase family serine peptidase [Zetaproteobacteria bacterium]
MLATLESFLQPHDSIAEMQWHPTTQTLTYIEKCGRETRLARMHWPSKAREILSPAEFPAFGPSINYGGGSYCADDKQVIFCGRDKALYRLCLQTSTWTQLTQSFAGIVLGSLSPCGSFCSFAAQTGETCHIWIVNIQQPEQLQQISPPGHFAWNPVFHTSGTGLTWYAWQQDTMPWDAACIQVATQSSPDSWTEATPELQTISIPQATCRNPIWSPSGNYLAYRCDHQGYDQLCIHNLATAEKVYWAPSEEGELGEPDWAPMQLPIRWGSNDQLLYILWTQQGAQQIYRVTFEGKTCSGTPVLPNHPQQVSTWATCGDDCTAFITSPDHPGKWVYTPSSSNTPKPLLTVARGKRLLQQLPTFENIRWQNKQGTTLYGKYYFARHKNRQAPTLVHLHGGPTGQQMASYNTAFNIFTAAGYNVFAVDYRGSSGYGRHYRTQLNGSWGIIDFEDTVSGVETLCQRGYAKPGHYILSGGSAGGLTAYQCLIYTPEYWGGAIVRYGVADPLALKQAEHFFEKGYGATLIGEEHDCKDHYHRVNALQHAGRIRAPLILFHGEQDPIVPLSHSSQMIANVASPDKQLITYAEEGHIFLQYQSNLDYFTRCIEFLDRITSNMVASPSS